MRTLIRDAEVVVTVDPDNRVLTQQSIVIEDSRIVALGATAEVERHFTGQPFDKVISGRDRLVTPGFVDAHLHFSEQLARGLFPDNLATRPWVFNWAKPVYAAVDREAEYIGTLLAGIEMMKTGSTCALDMGTQNDLGNTVAALERVGVRAITGRHAADVPPESIPEHWTPEMIEHHFFRNAEEALAELERCVRRYNGSAEGRVRVWVNIEGKEPCSAELHAGALALAEQLGVGTTYHVASSIEESLVSERRYGKWPVTRLHDIGALGPNLVLAHVVALQEHELDHLAESGVSVAFCPGTALKIAKGATKIGLYPEMLGRGINVALGCDGTSAAGSLDMLRQIYLAAGLFKDCRMDANLIPAVKALRMGTIDAAKALLWDDQIGSIEIGKKADMVLFDLTEPDWIPYWDPVQTLVWSVGAGSVHTVIIDGRVTMEARRVLTVDDAEVAAAARDQARRVVQRSGLRPDTPVTTEAYN